MSRIFQPNRSAMFAAFAFLLLAGASGIQAIAETQQVPQDTQITLERTLCYGMCPSYRLTISADGSVLFEGRKFVKKVGIAQSRISPETLRNLIDRFERINYFDLRNRYQDTEDGCEGAVMDAPSALTSIKINGKSKSVRHYLGCEGVEALDGLTKLEQAIDDAANTAQWIR
ncbi:MAG TPA: DUF6438 domain-containing protein [Blastocatellia bacterium]|nr:DUF6438 domain-containing protein [Blastocatellia bacterium]